MKRLMLVGIASAWAACAAAAGLEAATWEKWQHRAPLSVAQPGGKGAVRVDIPPHVYDVAREDNLDLRIGTASGQEVAYVIRRVAGHERREPAPATLYNHTYVPWTASSVTADFGGKLLKNELVINTAGSNFRRAVTIEGSDDGLAWSTVRAGAYLFRAPAGEGTDGWEREAVKLPDNDQRYLRITVNHGPDDPERIEIDGVRAARVVAELARTAPAVPAATGWTERVPETNDSEILLDLGSAKLPIEQVSLSFADANFLRRIDVFFRNREVRTEKMPREGGQDLERQFDEPWTPAGSFTLHRFSSGGSIDEALSFHLQGKRARYIRIRIRNQDDPALRFQGAQVSRFADQMVFPNSNEWSYWLYAGNAEAMGPQYDLPEFVDRLVREGAAEGRIGPIESNPAFGKPPALPWTERHRSLVWGALLAAVAALGLLVYRQARAATAVATD